MDNGGVRRCEMRSNHTVARRKREKSRRGVVAVATRDAEGGQTKRRQSMAGSPMSVRARRRKWLASFSATNTINRCSRGHCSHHRIVVPLTFSYLQRHDLLLSG